MMSKVPMLPYVHGALMTGELIELGIPPVFIYCVVTVYQSIYSYVVCFCFSMMFTVLVIMKHCMIMIAIIHM